MTAKGTLRPLTRFPPPISPRAACPQNFHPETLVPPVDPGRGGAFPAAVLHRFVERDAEQVCRGHHAGAEAMRREVLRADTGAGDDALDQPSDRARVDRQQAAAGAGHQVAAAVEATEQGAWHIAAGREPAAQAGDGAERRVRHRLDADLGAMAFLVGLGAADEQHQTLGRNDTSRRSKAASSDRRKPPANPISSSAMSRSALCPSLRRGCGGRYQCFQIVSLEQDS